MMKRVTGSVPAYVVLALVIALVAGVSACAGATEFGATCSVRESALGPYGEGAPLGVGLTTDQARAAVAETGYESFVEIAVSGNWNVGWEQATEALGNGIHRQLAWIDAHGEVRDLYRDGDAFDFAEVRVSRSFQGKLEHAHGSLFVGLEPGLAVGPDATCMLTEVVVGDEREDRQLDLLLVDDA